jgi:hypothetical protein
MIGKAVDPAVGRFVTKTLEGGGLPAEMVMAMGTNTRSQIFTGPKSRTWDAGSNAIARNMEAQGATPREIWSATGNWRTPGNNWSQEIPDNSAEFRTNFNASQTSKANNYKPGLEGPLGGMYRNQDLYAAYPQLLATDRMKVTKLPDWLPDSSNTASYSRTYGGKGITDVRNKTESGALDATTHEMQHGVQNLEGSFF